MQPYVFPSTLESTYTLDERRAVASARARGGGGAGRAGGRGGGEGGGGLAMQLLSSRGGGSRRSCTASRRAAVPIAPGPSQLTPRATLKAGMCFSVSQHAGPRSRTRAF